MVIHIMSHLTKGNTLINRDETMEMEKYEAEVSPPDQNRDINSFTSSIMRLLTIKNK